jgi:hypothetical protein
MRDPLLSRHFVCLQGLFRLLCLFVIQNMYTSVCLRNAIDCAHLSDF